MPFICNGTERSQLNERFNQQISGLILSKSSARLRHVDLHNRFGLFAKVPCKARKDFSRSNPNDRTTEWMNDCWLNHIPLRTYLYEICVTFNNIINVIIRLHISLHLIALCYTIHKLNWQQQFVECLLYFIRLRVQFEAWWLRLLTCC